MCSGTGISNSCLGRSESKTWHNGLMCTTEVVVGEKEVPVEKLKMSDENRQDTVTERLLRISPQRLCDREADIQEDGLCAEESEPMEQTEQCAGDVSGEGLLEEGRVIQTPANQSGQGSSSLLKTILKYKKTCWK